MTTLSLREAALVAYLNTIPEADGSDESGFVEVRLAEVSNQLWLINFNELSEILANFPGQEIIVKMPS